jgi:DNA-binding transcriptional LysR family regulator
VGAGFAQARDHVLQSFLRGCVDGLSRFVVELAAIPSFAGLQANLLHPEQYGVVVRVRRKFLATVVAIPPEVRISLLMAGRYLTIFPASALRFPTRRPELRVLPVQLPIARVPNGIVTLKNRTLSPVARLFVDNARKVAEPLTKIKG